jgi:hypothetical protein
MKVLLPLLAGLPAVAYHWWFQPDWYVSAVYAGGSVLGTAVLCVIYYRSAEVIMQRSRKALAMRVQQMQSLLKELEAGGLEQGARQGRQLLETMESFGSVTRKRFGKAGITVASYLAAAEQLENAILHNLKESLIAQESIEAIEQPSNGLPDASGVQTALVRRRELYTSQQAKITGFLNENESAITLLNETAVALSNIDVLSQADREQTYARLRELAERARQYIG